MVNWFSTRRKIHVNGSEILFSIKGSGTSGYSHAKEQIWTLTSYHIQKSKWIWDLNIREKTIKFYRKHRCKSFLWVGVLSSHLVIFKGWKEKAMATHSSILAWKLPWTEEPGRLQSMGSLRVGHDWATSLSLFTFVHWRRKWQPTPVFLPGESQGWGSLVGFRLWGCTKSDMTEAT